MKTNWRVNLYLLVIECDFLMAEGGKCGGGECGGDEGAAVFSGDLFGSASARYPGQS